MAVKQVILGGVTKQVSALQATLVKLPLPPGGFQLERGGILPEITVAFESYGYINATRDNVILLCHALTGSAHAADLPNTARENFPHLQWEKAVDGTHLLPAIREYPGWWSPLIGPGKALDTEKYCILVPNILGSCYGSTGPLSLNPETGKPYQQMFPAITVRDMVRVQEKWLQLLGIKRVTVIGGSLGGMQVLEWALMYPHKVHRIIPIATSAAHSPWAIAWNEIARQAIMLDPQYQEGNYAQQPWQGMALARMAAMISYRSFTSFQQKFGRQQLKMEQSTAQRKKPQFQVESYLHYQGEKFYRRFDANSYINLTRAMDWHDVGEGRGDVAAVLGRIQQPACVIGIPSDNLYPLEEQKFLSWHIPRARWYELKSLHGHDGFLIEWEALQVIISQFLNS